MPGGPDTRPLRPDSLADFAGVVDTPAYDRAALRRSIVHIGVGGFHRAHLATYVDELARAGETAWGIVGSGLLDGDRRMAEVLDAQDGLYCLISRDRDASDVTVIGSIVGYELAVDEPAVLQRLIADPAVQIVSLTITEGGYPVDDGTKQFLPEQAGPASVFGVLALALDERRRAHGAPLTIMSCDNVMGNGDVTRVAVLGAAQGVADDLVAWIGSAITFPNSMVDRITPATTAGDVEWLAETTGIDDGWPVVAEPFRQWVVEDRFAGDRLPLERLDVIITDDIEPYELVKLRLLNAGHSCLAYLAALEGIEQVHDAMADPALCRFVDDLLRLEAQPTLPTVEGIDTSTYIDTLIQRFANPGVGDQIARLCLDGTAKFPKFLLPTVAARLERGDSVDHAALALAGWCEYLASHREHAADPLLEAAVAAARRSVDHPVEFLALSAVFGDELGPESSFAAPFIDALERLRRDGVQSSLEVLTERLAR